MKRRGRPKGPEKVVFKRRIGKELEDAVDIWFDHFLANYKPGCVHYPQYGVNECENCARKDDKEEVVPTPTLEGDNAPALDSVGLAPKFIKVDDPKFREAAKKVMDSRGELMLRLTVSERDDQIKALLDDIQRLEGEKVVLEELLDLARNGSLDDKSAYWRARAFKAEAELKRMGDYL